jgi:hypothetical protein
MTAISLFSQLNRNTPTNAFSRLDHGTKSGDAHHPPAFTIIAMMNIGHNSFVALRPAGKRSLK